MNIFDQSRLNDRVAGVIGAAQGVGHAVGEALLSAGAHLAIVDIDADQATTATERLSAD